MTSDRRQRIAAYAVLTDSRDRVLLVKAAPEDSGRWFLPGGGVEFGEDPEAGLRREVEEETGQVVADGSLLACPASRPGAERRRREQGGRPAQRPDHLSCDVG